ncbi:MAG: hypothetical protein JXN59_06935 [Anaerolineae bacterium]|nr:hypothetical protein [Anaerolineae bacterium]
MDSAQDLASRLVSGMDPQLQQFLRERVNSFMKWDLMRFFHENPHTIDTAKNIAAYTGRDPAAIVPVLDALAAAGMLRVASLPGDEATRAYRLTTDPELRALLERFHQACQDRQFRVQAIYTVIQGME